MTARTLIVPIESIRTWFKRMATPYRESVYIQIGLNYPRRFIKPPPESPPKGDDDGRESEYPYWTWFTINPPPSPR